MTPWLFDEDVDAAGFRLDLRERGCDRVQIVDVDSEHVKPR